MTSQSGRSLCFLLLVVCCSFSDCKQVNSSNVTLLGDSTTPWNQRQRRLMLTDKSRHWAKGVLPYKFYKIDVPNGKDIRGAMATYEYYTPIRFVPWEQSLVSTLGHPGFLHFSTTYGRGWSLLGFYNTERGQGINCPILKTCIHEIGHALGFEHEQYHPDRDLWIRVNKENLGEFDTYKKMNWNELAFERTQFDISSIMLYGPRSWNPISLLFPEIPFEQRHFYMFKELCDGYECSKYSQCTGATITCHNEGYMSVIDGNCGCICPQGLDPATGCQSPTRAGPTVWPSGTFALLEPTGGCPDALFQKGMLRHTGIGDNKKMSDDFNGQLTNPMIELNFCTKSVVPKFQVSWPPGKYCYLKQGSSCSNEGGINAIYEAKLTIPGSPDTSNNAHSGEMPSGKFDRYAELDFCCVHKGLPYLPIRLPTAKPFILFARDGEICQNVDGMHVTMQKFGISGATVEGDLSTSKEGSMLYLHYCVYKPFKRDDCGAVIEMGPNKRSVTIQSDANSPALRQCTWLIQNSGGKGTLVFKFDEFKVTSTNPDCDDSIEIQPNRIGQKGIKYCGFEKEKSVRSLFGKLWVRFTSGENSVSHFKATIDWIPDEDMCYSVGDKGKSYRGMVDFTRTFQKCLPWSETTSCHHNAFKPGDYEAGLDGNYCRNPDGAFRPWCYTKLEGCVREFCDACLLETPYDTATDCASRKQNGACTRDSVDCAATCGVKDLFTVTKVKDSMCSSPGSVSGGSFEGPSKSTYEVGDKVTYKCTKSGNVIERTCQSTGKWSAANTACLPCPLGYSHLRDKCYKFFFEFESHDGASRACEKIGAKLAMPKTQDESDYLAAMKYPLNTMWLGGKRNPRANNFTWSDGSLITFFHWKFYDVPHPEQCVYMRVDNFWKSTDYCDSWKLNYVCEKQATDDKPPCTDFLDTCPSLVSRAPLSNCDLAPGLDTFCPYTCDQCDTFCHQDIQLTEGRLTEYTVYSSSISQRNNRRCTWNIKAPSQNGYLVLNFKDFSVKSDGEECVDSLEVRSHRYGPPFTRYCDANYTGSIVFDHENEMFLRFRTPKASDSNFRATVKWVPDSDMCYNVADKGWSYVGKVNYTETLEPCLSWSEAMVCVNNTLQDGYFLNNLEDNYCRNPDGSDKPWCYNKDCEKQYCDVCHLRKLTDNSTNCQQFKNSGKCQTDLYRAATECPLTCQTATKGPDKKAADTKCSMPGYLSGGVQTTPAVSSYNVGLKVTYKCDKTQLTVERTCLTSGQWSPETTACKECPYGFIPFKEKCYKYFPTYTDKAGAEDICRKENAVIATPKDEEQNHFVSVLRKGERIWLGGRKFQSGFKWNDGTYVTWYNWLLGRKRFIFRDNCMVLEKDETRTDDWCRDKLFHFVCQADRLVEAAECVDSIAHCPSLMAAIPNQDCSEYPSLQQDCRSSCGLCSLHCNQHVELTSQDSIQDISSKPGNALCTWSFGADTTAGRYVVTLDEFNLASTDTLTMKYTQLGDDKYTYTMGKYEKTTTILDGKLYIVFKTDAGSSSNFKATVRWTKDADMCYSVADNGTSYDGVVSYTRDFEPCLLWSDALTCDHNPLNQEDFSANLDHNYCRNPDKSSQPWCYTKACEKHYCDVCHIEKVVDRRTDCAAMKRGGGCTAESIGCAETCEITLTEDIQAVSGVQCRTPGSVSGGRIVGFAKRQYSVGEKVVYKCNKNDFNYPVERTCLSSGKWSNADTACLQCPFGFSSYQGNCYKYFNMRINYMNAELECKKHNARVATPKTEAKNNFLYSMSFVAEKLRDMLWLGAQKNVQKGTFYWNDNTPFSYAPWRDREPFSKRDNCALLTSNTKWEDDWCHDKAYPFICEANEDPAPDCKDYDSNCASLLFMTGRRTCDTGSPLENICRVSCGLCPRDCEHTLQLSAANPTTTISLDRRSQSNRICTWNLKGDHAQGRFVIEFDEFDMKPHGNKCPDYLEIKKSEYADPFKSYCNTNKETLFEKVGENLVLQYRGLDTSSSHFKATITWVDDSNLCYSVKDNGQSYIGDTNHTEMFQPCLPWGNALGCPHNPLVEEDFFDNLDDNYCRNPDKSERPWCYVNTQKCEKQYCDVCHLEKAEDMFDASFCTDFKSKGFCSTKKDYAISKCAATCDAIESDPVTAAKLIHCKPPPDKLVSGGVIVPLKASYSVGEVVTYKCHHSYTTSDSVCLTNGQWSEAHTACLVCPYGWTSLNSMCYKMVDKFVEYYDAVYECKQINATIAMPKTADINTFVTTFCPKGDSLWIGAKKNDVTNEFFWNDGDRVDWTNWRVPNKAMTKRDDCVRVSDGGMWNDDWCNNKFFNFVCEMPIDDDPECLDVIDQCPNRIALTADKKCNALLDKFCHHSCTGCA